MTKNQPRRRHCLTLEIHSDDKEGMFRALQEIALHWDRGMPSRSVTGGCDSAWTIEYQEDPEMTPERYQSALREYLDRLNADVNALKDERERRKKG